MQILPLLRRLLRLREPVITAEQALAIAEAYCKERSEWYWDEDAYCEEGLSSWYVYALGDRNKIVVEVDNVTGAVVHSAFRDLW